LKFLSANVIILLLFICVQYLWCYTNLTPAEVQARLVAGDTVLVLDVREVDEYEAGHMAEPLGNLPLTPVNMPLNSNILEQQFSLLPRDIDIIVYCRSGARSATASLFLESQDFTRIYNMTGGFSSWGYEFRTGGFGDHSGRWIRSNDPSPVTLLFGDVSETSKVIFPTSALPEGVDSVYLELQLAPATAHVPPQKPDSDIENVYRLTVLDRFGLPLFDVDSLLLPDSVSVYFSLRTEVDNVLNPLMYVYVPDDGWPLVTTHFDSMVFINKDTVLRKWYYLGAEYDPTRVENIKKNDYPGKFELYKNYPNPFNPTTNINYELQITNYVELSIYNSLGQKIITLVSEKQEAGYHQIEWDASGFASGKKMILIQ
jgi:rhodanese-related sulfurtransferase